MKLTGSLAIRYALRPALSAVQSFLHTPAGYFLFELVVASAQSRQERYPEGTKKWEGSGCARGVYHWEIGAIVDPRVRFFIVANAMIGVFLTGFSARIFLIALPTLARGLGTDMLGVSWALISYQVAGIGLGVVFGRLGDIYGHRRIYGFGIIVITLGCLLCAVAQDILQLILFRFLQGVGGAVLQSVGRALALEAMPQGSEGKTQGLLAMAHQFGFFVGPPVGGFIIEWIGWRWTFLFMAVPGVAGIVLTYLGAQPEPRPARRAASVDYVGSTLFLLMTLMVTLILDRKSAEVLGVTNKAFLILAFAGTLWGFLSHEKKIPSPIINLSFFKISLFAYSTLGLLMMCVIQGLTAFVKPFYLQEILHLTPTAMGFLFLVPSIVNMALAPVCGHMSDRIGPRTPMVVGALLFIVASLLGVSLRADSHWVLPTILLGLTGIGTAFFNAPVQGAMVSVLPKEHWGSAAGIIHTIFGLGHLLGISFGTLLLTVAFRYYTGIAGAAPDPSQPAAFVPSMNVAYAAAAATAFIPVFTSLLTEAKPGSYSHGHRRGRA